MLNLGELQGLSYEPQLGTAGQRYALTLAAGDGAAATDYTVTLAPVFNACDEEAGAPLDLQGVTKGRLPNEIDPRKALAACEAAVKAFPNVPRFLYQLGRAQMASGQPKLAFETIKKAAEAGHIRAVQGLASLYALGVMGTRDPVKGHKTVREAAEKGDPYALFGLGKDMFYGIGTAKNTSEGLKYMTQAADLGHTYAFNELGFIYLYGNAVPADPARAFAFYQAGLARDDIYSMNNIARMYRDGIGVERDYARARELFERAALQGQPYAPTNLGRMYRDGLGVPKDMAAAVRWLELGAERGDYWGAYDRALIALADSPAGPKSEVVAARYFALAAAVNLPASGDAVNKAAKELAKLPAKTKQTVLDQTLKEMTPKEASAFAKGSSLDDRLVAAIKFAWQKRNPRYDLF